MATAHSGSGEKWSADVTENSNAMDLKPNIFESKDPREIARSLKKSAEHSTRRKSEPYRSAMSMLTFYINRAGKNPNASQKAVLENAKGELRKALGGPDAAAYAFFSLAFVLSALHF